MLYPFIFKPILKDRVWGGDCLKTLFHKSVPDGHIVGESWEISDRHSDVSVISNGLLAGQSIRWLMENHSSDVLGDAHALDGRFPLLCKVLDAHEKLSLQVHPPASMAQELGGEPKTEAWYVAEARPDADIFAGLKSGTSRREFESRLKEGTVAECFHRIHVKRGDVMFLPSGRVHALGAGSVIFEVQQNSDTTYRVFDWNRIGADGKPRALHVEQALRCIDFDDFEPGLVEQHPETVSPGWERTPLVACEAFTLSLFHCRGLHPFRLSNPACRVIAAVEGEGLVCGGGHQTRLQRGQFCLVPACLEEVSLAAGAGAVFWEAMPA